MHVRSFPYATLAAMLAVELLFIAFWFVSTALTGKTYHFDPILIAAAPPVVMGIVRGRGARGVRGVTPAVVGLASVAAGWLLLMATGNTPTATFLHAQPGGVPGEVAVAALVGVAAGTRWLRRGSASDP